MMIFVALGFFALGIVTGVFCGLNRGGVSFQPHDRSMVNMAKGELTIYVASDDLMEFEGDFERKGNPSSYEPNFIFLNDGTVIECELSGENDEYWPLKVVKLGPGTIIKEHRKSTDEDTPDTLTLSRSSADPFKWFEIWSSVDGPTKDELVEKIENDAPDWDDFDYDTLLSIYNKIKGR